MEPRAPRRGLSRSDLSELGERVTRVETTAGHITDSLLRIDAQLSKMEAKMDTLAMTMAHGVGGLRVGVVMGQVAAGVLGFVAARFWPMSK